jgi:hypothetical protein
LSESGAAFLPKLMRHPLAAVRAGACRALQRFVVPAGAESAAALLDDASPDVRSAALRALLERAPNRYAEPVKALLRRETDSNVVSSAFFALERQNLFTPAELRSLEANAPTSELRQRAAWARSKLERR